MFLLFQVEKTAAVQKKANAFEKARDNAFLADSGKGQADKPSEPIQGFFEISKSKTGDGMPGVNATILNELAKFASTNIKGEDGKEVKNAIAQYELGNMSAESLDTYLKGMLLKHGLAEKFEGWLLLAQSQRQADGLERAKRQFSPQNQSFSDTVQNQSRESQEDQKDKDKEQAKKMGEGQREDAA